MNFTYLKILIALLFIFLGNFCFLKAQPGTIDNQKLQAEDYIKYEDYNRGLEAYLKLYKQKKDDIDINYYLGLCYLNVNGDKTLAMPHLEFVKLQNPKYKGNLQFLLGRAFFYSYKFDEAIIYFNNYRKECLAKEYKLIDKYIANCEDAKVLMKNPVNVTFQNLGKEINTKFPDYYPFVVEDEGIMYFTSRRDANVGNLLTWQGFYSSDIYFSKVKNGEWTKAKNIGPAINTSEDEQCVHVSPDGKTMLVYKDDAVNKIIGDLFITRLQKNKTMGKPETILAPINSEKTNELEGYLFVDENTIIIASDKEGTFGGMDLFMHKKLPNGNWGAAINLGPNINTTYDEAFPLYDEKNKILYFSSEGHINMGGHDIFKSQYDEKTETFGKAMNIGYPINTPEDNMEFTLMPNRRDGYTAAVRKEGFGDLDIYRVIFNEVAPRPTVINGYILTTDSLKKDIDAEITITDIATKKELDSKKVNRKTGRYVFAVEPGKKYLITVKSAGYVDISEEISIYDKSDYTFEKEKNFTLIKAGGG